MINLSIQEKLRKPLLGLTTLLHRAKLTGAWYQFTGPINRYLLWQSPYFKSLDPTLIVDVGANTGEFLMHARRAFPRAKVLAFEPHPDAVKAITERYKGDQQILVEPVGLGSQSGTATLFVTDFSPGSSVVAKPVGQYQEVPISIRRLDDYCQYIPAIGKILIKIDVEGFELEVLKGGESFLQKAHYLYLEARTTKAIGCSFEEIYLHLKPLGWQYVGAFDSVFASSGELLYFDALFERDSLKQPVE